MRSSFGQDDIDLWMIGNFLNLFKAESFAI
jgi:hypothetical protein